MPADPFIVALAAGCLLVAYFAIRDDIRRERAYRKAWRRYERGER